ncbi:MAG: MFS transporter [Bryobacteraceae bacterium]
MERMTMAQVAVVAITVLLNAMDGFDVLSIAFALPGIAAEWKTSAGALGLVSSMELIGMAIGSLLLGGVADKIGRRPTLLGCLLVMAAGIIGATTSGSLYSLSAWRVFTGLGIGGMLSGTNAVATEFSNKRWRALAISLMVIGYPLGGTLGGMMIRASIDPISQWRSIFYIGAAATVILLPALYFAVPESIHWLTRTQPENALARVNGALRKLGHPVVSALPEVHESDRKKSVTDILSPALIATTLILTAGYFLHTITFYFILKWTPKIATDLGFPGPIGTGMLAWVNFGGAIGGALFGMLAARLGIKPLTIGIMFTYALGVAYFGQVAGGLGLVPGRDGAGANYLTWTAGFVGTFGNAAMSGLYSMISYGFPTHVRATGTGFVIGLGRIGGVIGPWMAGLMLDKGSVIATIALFLSFGSLLSGLMLMFLKMGAEGPEGKKQREGLEAARLRQAQA